MRTRAAVAGLMVLGVIGLTGCGSTGSSGSGTTSSTSVPGHELVDTAWVLESYRGPNGATTPAGRASVADLAFEPRGVLVGSSGCNRFTGTYVAKGTSLSVVLGPTTLIACSSAALNAQEAALFKLLPEVSGYALVSDQLVLTGDGGATLLTYSVGLSGLAGTSWTATGVNNGNGGVESTSATEQLTADFGTDGTFSGFGGCNTLSGSYAVTGRHGLTLTDLTSTQKACSTEIDALESQYSAALGKVTQYAVTGDELTLRNGTGETQVVYRLAG